MRLRPSLMVLKLFYNGGIIQMENTNLKLTSGGGGFFSLLTVAFIVLKLTGYIDWPWVWVLAPLWIPLTIVAIVFIIFLIIVFGLNV